MAFTLCHVTFASDPSSVQDFCVADFNNQGTVKLNGFACKDPARVQADDFSFSGMHIYGNTGNSHGSLVTPMTVTQIPGLNTLGISMARIDYGPWGVVPPHYHPRTLEVGFVTSNPEYRLISKTLQKGDVFVFPVGLIHFQRNVGKTNAVVIAALSSQNPGVVTVANAVFGSKPDIATDLLAKAFQVDKNIVQQLQWKF
ncbi:Putative germin-like protein 2-1 [Linum perenne]